MKHNTSICKRNSFMAMALEYDRTHPLVSPKYGGSNIYKALISVIQNPKKFEGTNKLQLRDNR